ncbi:MAG: Minf_1886 family protein [Gemmatimonadota bacterium]
MSMTRLDASTRDRLSEMDGGYDERAYAFVLAALEQVVERLPQRRHVTGRELAEGCRELGLRLYGPLARTVLEHWRIRSTRDIGEIVFNLLEVGVLSKDERDSRDDFDEVFDFADVFERNYPWGGKPLPLSE